MGNLIFLFIALCVEGLVPIQGSINTLVATIVGQLILSVILDHFGVFDLARYPVSVPRILGCIGLLVSLFLIQYR